MGYVAKIADFVKSVTEGVNCLPQCAECKNKNLCKAYSSSSEVTISDSDGPLDLVSIATDELQTSPPMQMAVLGTKLPSRGPAAPKVPGLDLARISAAVPVSRSPFEVQLVREGPQWRHFGFTVGLDDNPSYLTVDALWSPSLISEWNACHTPTHRVCTGDLIMSANALKGNNESLLKEIQSIGKGEKLRLSIDCKRPKFLTATNPQEAAGAPG